MTGGFLLRDATAKDAPILADIYGWHCQNGAGTFEETPPAPDEMARRLAMVRDHALPFVVAEEAGVVTAFAYAAPFRHRGGYRYTAEDSVYVRHDRRGRGLGKAALTAVIEACRARGLSQLIAVIGGSTNAASIGLHSGLGFDQIAVLPSLGFKGGAFVDVVWMQKSLGPSAGEGLKLEG